MILRKIITKALYQLKKTGLVDRMDDEKYLKLLFRIRVGKALNLEKPETFNEKMQWLKIHNRRPEYTMMVDKYAVKKYIADVLGEQYVIPNIGVWDYFEDIDFEVLPNQFVMKCTHDSGGLIICKDKSTLNLKEVKEKIEHCMKRNYYYSSREWPYKNVKPRIIVEEYIENNEEGLHDYKIWCFNGEPVYIQYITGRIGNETYEGFYDSEWNLQNFYYHNPLMKESVKKPDCLDTLLSMARKLAQKHPFMRCDFYVLEDGSIRFGEITFFPMSGMEKWNPKEMDEIFGGMIDTSYGK